MANRHATLASLFNDIANAIRSKDGTSADIVADNFDTRVGNLNTGRDLGANAAVAGEILSSKKAVVNNAVVTGTMPNQTPAFDGGGTSATISPTISAPTVVITESGTFTTSTGSNYGVTTTKPSGTDGTNYLTVDATHTETNGSVSGSAAINRNAVLYNGAVAGYVSQADNATALAASTNSGTASITSTAIDPTVTDNFEPYYIPIVTPAFDGGALTGGGSAGSVTTTPVVTPAISGNITDITTTTQPSGTSGTDYWILDPSGSVTTTGKVTGSATVKRNAVLYNGAKKGAVNIADNTTALAADTTGKTVSVDVSVTPTVAAGTNRYLAKAALGASSSITNVSGSGSVSPGTNSISKNSNTNVSTGTITTTKPSSGYYVAIDASTAANSGSISVSGSGTANATVGTAGYAPTSLTGSGTASASGSASVTIPAKAASTTYLPITSTSASKSGGTVSWETGYIASGSATVSRSDLGITDKAAATYNTSTTDQTIAAGQYLTGAQTIKAVTTSNIDATNIKAGVVVKVGDANSAGRIKNVTGTFTSDATATAANIFSGKIAYVNGAAITGTAAVTTTLNSGTDYTMVMPAGLVSVS